MHSYYESNIQMIQITAIIIFQTYFFLYTQAKLNEQTARQIRTNSVNFKFLLLLNIYIYIAKQRSKAI
jgi:hypothetical protein